MQTDSNIEISYTFNFENYEKMVFDIKIDRKNLLLIKKNNDQPPDWAKMKNFRCPHCPLQLSDDDYCPLAVRLKEVIDLFSDIPSYENVKVEVKTENRTYIKETSVQRGVGALVGLYMPTSGCPILGRLKALVRFHLPFATIEETEYRVFSTYLFAQFIRNKRGDLPDWDLNGLKQLYNDITKLNHNVARRIADLEKLDASINSLITLNNFADSISFCLDEDEISGYENLLSSLFD